jgi:hypothetical protein
VTVTRLEAKAIRLWINSRENNAAAPTNSNEDVHLFLRILVLVVTELFALALCIISVTGSWQTRMNDLLVACRGCYTYFETKMLMPDLFGCDYVVPFVILVIFVTQKVSNHILRCPL